MSERARGLMIAGNPALTAGYLRSVAASLGASPSGEVPTAAQLRDCIKTLLRIEQGLSGADSPSTPMPADAEQWPSLLDGIIARHADIAGAFDEAQDQARRRHDQARAFDRERCEAYLRGHTGSERLRIVRARVLPGGRSKLTVLLELEAGASLPAQLVMRQDWAAGGVQGTTVVSEFALLRHLADAGLKVPRPLLIETASEPLGAPFMMVTRMDGVTTGDYFTTTATAAAVLDLATQLGHLHSLSVDTFTGALPEDPQTPDTLAERLHAMAALREQMGDDSTIAALCLQWLQAQRTRLTPQRALLHNDIGCHNLLIDGDALGAILDWELASIGHPAADLGYARGWVEAIVPWPAFMQCYTQAGGPPIDEFTLDYYTVWSGLRLYVMMLQAGAGLSSGMIRDLEIAVICADSTPRLLQRMATDLRRALQTSNTRANRTS